MADMGYAGLVSVGRAPPPAILIQRVGTRDFHVSDERTSSTNLFPKWDF